MIKFDVVTQNLKNIEIVSLNGSLYSHSLLTLVSGTRKSKYSRQSLFLTDLIYDRLDKLALRNNSSSSSSLRLSTAPYRASSRHNNGDTFARLFILPAIESTRWLAPGCALALKRLVLYRAENRHYDPLLIEEFGTALREFSIKEYIGKVVK